MINTLWLTEDLNFPNAYGTGCLTAHRRAPTAQTGRLA
jgi:hypothetical protein